MVREATEPQVLGKDKRLTLILIMIVLMALWGGYALSVLWGWFIVPIFEAPPLSIAQAIGISITARFLFISTDAPGSETDDVFVYHQISRVISPALALALGALVRGFL